MNAQSTDPQSFTTSSLSRRRFLQGLALTTGSLWLAACIAPAAPLTQSSTSEAAGQAQGADAAKYGGTYRAMFGNDVPTLDGAAPPRWQDFWAMDRVLYNKLLVYDADTQLVPDLASDLPAVSDDGLVYTIPLRQGVKFHDGTVMTAQDVKFSYDRIFWPELGSPMASFFANIAGSDAVAQGDSRTVSGVEVVDDHTIRMTLKEPQAVFQALLTTNFVLPQKAVEAAGSDWGVKTVVGTGPFKLVEWLPGDKISFDRHSEYFKPGLPYLDRVELYLNVPEETRVLHWENGEAEYVDYFDGVQAGELPRILNDPKLAPLLRVIPTPIFDYLQIADNAAPFTDLRVRQAIAMALDKQALADSTGQGASEPLDDIYTKFLPMYQPDFASAYQYDPAAAKQLLADAGFAGGIKGVDMYVDFHPYQGAIVQADLAKIGIEVNILDGEPGLYQDKINSGEIPLVFTGYGPLIMDGSDILANVFGCAGTHSPSRAGLCNGEMHKLFDQANTMSLADPKRNELFGHMQDIAVNDMVYLIPAYRRNVLGLGQSYIKGETYYYLPTIERVYFEM
jgi:ABC-type transport system substrate-binding protein